MVRDRPRTGPRQNGQVETSADADFAALGLISRELENRLRPARAGRAPRRQRPSHLEHLALSREKDDVDREAHEERVHRPRRPKQQPLPALEPTPPELMPKQVISLLGLGGPSFPLANHYDHIHIGY